MSSFIEIHFDCGCLVCDLSSLLFALFSRTHNYFTFGDVIFVIEQKKPIESKNEKAQISPKDE